MRDKIKEKEEKIEHEIEEESNIYETTIDQLVKDQLEDIVEKADDIEGDLIVEERELQKSTKNVRSKGKKRRKKRL